MHIHAKLSAQNPISDSARSQPHSHANKKSYRHFRHHTLTIASSTSNKVTFQEVQDIARSRDLHISLKTIGPAYRIVCRDHSESGPILAVTSGFLIPFLGLMHCDMLQIFTKGKKGEEAMRTRGGILGLGLLVGGATFSYGYESGCHTAEILAINDDDAWHARLVKYYSRFGFKPVYVVTGGTLADLPHMLVWGGVGTRMDADVDTMLDRWTPAIRSSKYTSFTQKK